MAIGCWDDGLGQRNRGRSQRVAASAVDDWWMHPEGTDQTDSVRGSHSAVLIPAGLLLFLGGHLVVPLTGALDGVGYVWANVAGVTLRYIGALMVALCCFGLARRTVVRLHAGEQQDGRCPTARRRPRYAGLALVVVGLALMAVAEMQTPVLLYQLEAGNSIGRPFDSDLGTLAQRVFVVSAYLGPVVTAAGAYLGLRRLEAAVTARPPASPTSTDARTDLDA